MEKPQWKPKDRDTYALIDRLFLERIPLAGIARVLQLSESWLQPYVNIESAELPQQAEVIAKTTSRRVVQMDELWSFVDEKGNQRWVWLAIDGASREIIGCHLGDRSTESAPVLWHSLPRHYRHMRGFIPTIGMPIQVYCPSKRHWNFIHYYNQKIREKLQREQMAGFSLFFT